MMTTEIIIWNWDFDNEQFSNNTSPNISYNTIDGNITYYSPSLYVETNNGCKNLITKNNKIVIHPSPVAIITTPLIELGPGLYNFDGSQSITSNNITASPNLFNYIYLSIMSVVLKILFGVPLYSRMGYQAIASPRIATHRRIHVTNG